MNITDAYHIVLAAYFRQMDEQEYPSDISDYLSRNEEAETAWDSLSATRQKNFENFSRENIELFDSFPSSYQNDEDMEQREEAIKAIEEKLYATFSFIE